VYSLRDAVERSSRGGGRVVLQRVQRQARGRHQGGRSRAGGNGQPADGPAGGRRAPVQPGTVRGDQKRSRGRAVRGGGAACGHRFRGECGAVIVRMYVST